MLTEYLYVFFISMVPIVELRCAIPIGIGLGLPMLPTYIVAVIGNMVPVPFIFFFARKVLLWGRTLPGVGGLFNWMYQKGERGGQKLKEKAGRGLFWALLFFVGIPLPGTGAWTGTLAASILDMDFKSSVLAAMGGVLLAGMIMGIGSLGVFGALGAVMG